jgi:cell division protein FtsI (penicillin-binding protein 3)
MYYQPTLVHGFRDNGVVVPAQPIEKGRAISREASSDLVKIMEEYIALQTPEAQRAGFVVGGKTGTAQVPSSSGGYRTDVFNATYAGFVGRSRPKYVIAVRLNEGLVSQNFNGYKDGRPVFLGIIAGIMDNVAISE